MFQDLFEKYRLKNQSTLAGTEPINNILKKIHLVEYDTNNGLYIDLAEAKYNRERIRYLHQQESINQSSSSFIPK